MRYIHAGGQLGVGMVEVNCESDFVARTDDFKRTGVHDIATVHRRDGIRGSSVRKTSPRK